MHQFLTLYAPLFVIGPSVISPLVLLVITHCFGMKDLIVTFMNLMVSVCPVIGLPVATVCCLAMLSVKVWSLMSISVSNPN